MKTKHTPGPWEIDINTIANCYCYTIHETQGGESEEEAEANAQLIAAAPEMLEALIACKEILEKDVAMVMAADAGNNNALAKCRIAIKKAIE